MNLLKRLVGVLRRGRRSRVAQQAGQAMPLFMLMVFVITGSIAMVTDVSWFWVNQQRMQRAADAAALAGAVYLPADPTSAYSAARAAAVENGFTNGSGGVVVTPLQDPNNSHRLGVTVSGPVDTFFARVFGFTQTTIAAVSRAEYTLPVPMGSPQNYYGVGYYVGPTTTVTTNSVPGTTGARNTGASVAAGQWTTPNNVFSNNDLYATAANNNDTQMWTTYGLQGGAGPVPNDPTLVVDGIQVMLDDIAIVGSGVSTNCQVRAEVTWNAGTTWSTAQLTTALTPSTVSVTNDTTVGLLTSTAGWGARAWAYGDFSDANFRVRLTWLDSTGNCASTWSVQLDHLRVDIAYTTTTTTSTTTWALKPVLPPYGGAALAPQNFWAAMQSQGAPSVQGDAFMTKYQTRKSTTNPSYDYVNYYNYGVDMPVGSSGGEIWVFDPGFCDTGTGYGLGENWTVGGSNGNVLEQPVSSYYEVWDTVGTPWDVTDDVRMDTTTDDTDYRRLKLSDPTSPGARVTDSNTVAIPSCSGLSWHFGWVKIADNLPGGRTYRLHTYSTDKTSLTDQDDTTALNAFAIWATATGGTPKVYGIGAMEAYVKLPASTVSEFYLAQVEAAHAGKTLVIELWDPGDTGGLTATLEILAPNATNYAATTFSWSSAKGSTNAGTSSCDGLTGTNVTSVVTSTGTSRFNGCWVTIIIPLPSNYTAPHPSTDSVTSEAGWWKIRYSMGSGTNPATDLTTWKVAIRGSPVHLVP